MPETVFRVGDWWVRPAALELEGPGGRITLEAKPLEVLMALVERAGETCTRSQLLATVWGDKFVGEEVLTHSVWELRRALGDPARESRYIQTVPRRGYRLVAPVTVGPEPAPAALPASEAGPAPRKKGGPGRWLALVVLALAVLASWAASTLRAAEPRRVLVLAPKAVGGGPDARSELVALNVEGAVLGVVASLEGLAAVTPEYLGEGIDNDQQALAAVPAEELLVTQIRLAGDIGTLLLRRERSSDRAVLASSSASISLRPEDSVLLADVVRGELHKVYAEESLRPGRTENEVRDDDYRAYLELRHRMARGEVLDLAGELDAAERLLGTSPRFLEGYLLAADLGRSLYSGTHQYSVFERVSRLLGMARRLSPDDPRTLLAQARLELERGEKERAAAILLELRRVSPEEVQLPLLEARIAQQRGRLDEAQAVMQEAVRRFPSWQNRYRLADLETRTGQVAAARSELRAVLDAAPGNTWAAAKLGELELLYGDLATSVEIYARLAAKDSPRGPDLVNLGVARSLQGDFRGAVQAFERALERTPDHPAVLLNLAESLSVLGETERARGLCEQVLGQPGEGLTAGDRMIRAQCAALLGRRLEAVALAQEALADAREQPELIYQAAVVYARVGDRSSALVNLRHARELGVQARWFSLPLFGPLAADPEFRRIAAGG